jgi:hypothetical protein
MESKAFLDNGQAPMIAERRDKYRRAVHAPIGLAISVQYARRQYNKRS